MKKTDIAMVILIASLSVLIAYFVANALAGDMVSESVKVKTVDSISSEVSEPNKNVFKSDAINPTVEVIIGGSVDVSQLGQ